MKFINSLRGTRDILPTEMKYWHLVEEKAHFLLTNANYTEIRTPILEHELLFARGVGEETDIVNKEMYSFEDQGGRHVTLRPEGTAGISRSFIENKLYTDKPSHKFWYIGPMFRYERPQSGRQRQFHQLGIEYLGIKDPLIDAEVIKLAHNFLTNLGITDFIVEINNIGNKLDRHKYEQKLRKYLQKYESKLDSDSQKRLTKNPLRILDSKNPQTQQIIKQAPILLDYINPKSKHHFQTVCTYLNALNIPYKINYQLVRGLDYYSDTAFEFKTHLLGGQDTICGGGRYDNLIEQLGGPYTPAIGWAIGIERLMILLKQKVDIEQKHVECYIVSDNSIRCKLESLIMFNQLLNQDIKVHIDSTTSTLRKKIKRAYKVKSKYCLIIGEEEIAEQKITLKDLVNNKNAKIDRNSLLINDLNTLFH
nr:syh [Erythrocladia irregularis]